MDAQRIVNALMTQLVETTEERDAARAQAAKLVADLTARVDELQAQVDAKPSRARKAAKKAPARRSG